MSIVILSVCLIFALFVAGYCFVLWQEESDRRVGAELRVAETQRRRDEWHAAASTSAELYQSADEDRNRWKLLAEQRASRLAQLEQQHRTLWSDLDKVLLEKIKEHGVNRLQVPPKKPELKRMVREAVRERIVREVRDAILRSVGPDDTIDGRLVPNELDYDGSISWLENMDGGVYGT